MVEVIVLKTGVKNREFRNKHVIRKPCTSSITLIKTNYNLLVDTGAQADEQLLLTQLEKNDISPSDINYLVNTHWHPDHTSNNHLFPNAKLISGNTIWLPKIDANESPWDSEVEKIKDIEIIRTPGHTIEHLSVLAKSDVNYIISGDAFYEKDLEEGIVPKAYDNLKKFKESARKIIENADVIIPGHGEILDLDEEKKKYLLNLVENLKKD